jgi:uncharacterized damage-inducible protein DinB
MPDYKSLLEEALDAWSYTRHGVVEEIENFSDAELTFKSHSQGRTPAELAFHIIESGLMMAGELSRRDGNFHRQSFAKFIQEYAGYLRRSAEKSEIVELLKRTHAEGDRKIRAAGELMMLQFITRFDGRPGTRLTWMHHGIAHEEYHRGQLAMYARLVGRVPALTQRIEGGRIDNL